MPSLPTAETNHPDMAPFPGVASQRPGGRWLHWATSTVGRTEVDTYSGFEFFFPVHNAFSVATIYGLTECCIHCHDIPCRITSEQGTYFPASTGGSKGYGGENFPALWSHHPLLPHVQRLGSWSDLVVQFFVCFKWVLTFRPLVPESKQVVRKSTRNLLVTSHV